MADHVEIPFQFSYEHRYYPQRGDGSRGGLWAPFLGSAIARVPSVSAADTRLVARINTCVNEKLGRFVESSFELRLFEGRLIRPVFRPDAFVPCTAEDFRLACDGSVPWRDSPFVEHPHRDRAAVAINADVIPMDRYGARKWERDSREEPARVEALARAGRLVVVDGIAYRPTDEPRLKVMGLYSRAGTNTLSWIFEAFARDDDPVAGSTGNADNEGALALYDSWNLNEFRLDREQDARRCAEGFDRPLPLDGGRPVVEDLDPRLLRNDEDILRMTGGLERVLRLTPASVGTFAPILLAPDDRVAAFLDAKRIVGSFSDCPPDEAMVRKAFERLAFAVDCPPAAEITVGYLQEAVKRWRICERDRRAPEPYAELEEGDEQAFDQAFSP